MPPTFYNFIGGASVPAAAGETFENRNPADWSDVIGLFPRSRAADVDAAVAAARTAYNPWRLTPAPRRGDIVRRAGEILTLRKDELARVMTREMGKPVFETRGDVQEAIDTAYYAATEGRRLFGMTVPSELPNKMNMSVRTPVGVCAVITAWNFPMAVPSWKILPGLVAGNTIVFKPAEDAPHTAALFAEILAEAGLPPGVLNVVHGLGSEAGEAIATNTGVDLVAFTGSTAVGKHIASVCGERNARVSLEMGGKNAQIVMDDADVDLALDGVVWGAFGTTGQRCTATSRLILHEKVYDGFINRLIMRAGKLRLGSGLRDDVDVGPLIRRSQRERVHAYVEAGHAEGAVCVLGGGIADEGDLSLGWFYKPTVFIDVRRDMRIAREEIFGPVLSVLKASSLDEAIDIANDCAYGLSSSIYTRDVSAAFRAMRDLEAGITYINAPTIGAEAHMPFGGIKGTGNGHREGGWTAFEIFTEWKTIYVDYSGGLQRAQIDNG